MKQGEEGRPQGVADRLPPAVDVRHVDDARTRPLRLAEHLPHNDAAALTFLLNLLQLAI